jgi:F0F1-type ATP synthase assembly protein I
MASSNQRERELARAKHERQKARRDAESSKQDRTKIIAVVLILAMVLLTTGGVLLGILLN